MVGPWETQQEFGRENRVRRQRKLRVKPMLKQLIAALTVIRFSFSAYRLQTPKTETGSLVSTQGDDTLPLKIGLI